MSDLRVTPGARYDVELRTDYDPVRGKVASLGTLLNWHPYRQSFINIAHFNLSVTPIRQPGETSFARLWAGAR